eukprot:TRINITY_DN6954_c0_g5_i1.p1 TRINITY_DN6954_c0_g5~~TRINITY_DN6954_c0_g5_i1.p1  ORF type:complete len:158 (+),score=56.47 TRINITY_DN6954_c0_g5_i1:69-476(+)
MNKRKILGMIALAASLATGFLLNLLSCALYGNWLPLLVVICYALAPMPNVFYNRCCASQEDPFDNTGSGWRDLCNFMTGLFIVSGFGILAVLTHSHLIGKDQMLLAGAGGLVVYISIIVYVHFFHGKYEEEEGVM